MLPVFGAEFNCNHRAMRVVIAACYSNLGIALVQQCAPVATAPYPIVGEEFQDETKGREAPSSGAVPKALTDASSGVLTESSSVAKKS